MLMIYRATIIFINPIIISITLMIDTPGSVWQWYCFKVNCIRNGKLFEVFEISSLVGDNPIDSFVGKDSSACTVDPRFINHSGVGVGVEHGRKTLRSSYGYVATIGNPKLFICTAGLGSDQNYSVGCPRPINSRRCSIFQNGNRSDIFWVNAIHIPRYTVDYYIGFPPVQ